MVPTETPGIQYLHHSNCTNRIFIVLLYYFDQLHIVYYVSVRRFNIDNIYFLFIYYRFDLLKELYNSNMCYFACKCYIILHPMCLLVVTIV